MIANEIKEGRLVIFDVGQIDNEEARRIVDFMSGAAYGVNGKVRRVQRVFLLPLRKILI